MSIAAKPQIIPIILAGGNGRRLRPLTGPARPKPFLKLGSRFSLFQNTLKRFSDYAAPVVVCHRNFVDVVQQQAAEIDVKLAAIIAEPESRGTAAAVIAGTLWVRDRLPGTDVLVSPSDHYIPDAVLFKAQMHTALSEPAERFILFGVKPRSAETRYGYILCDAAGAFTGFSEKPEAQKALIYYMKGHCLWNSGIFYARPNLMLEYLVRRQPAILQSQTYALKKASIEGDVIYPDAGAYRQCPDMAIDRALIEYIPEADVIRLNLCWSDVGCLTDYARMRLSQLKAAC